MSLQRLQLGKKGEQLVTHYLKNQGYTICATNFSLRCGEIDIIAEKQNVRAFVEVKLRRTNYFATSQVVTPAKQKKIIQTARRYNCEQALGGKIEKDFIFRFDIALVEPTSGDDYHITYLPNAFAPESTWS